MTAYENKNMLKIFQNAPATSKYQIIKKAIVLDVFSSVGCGLRQQAAEEETC